MIETVALAQATATAPAAVGPVARAPAETDAVQRFAEAMAAGSPPPPVAPAPVAASIADAFPLRPSTLGDRVLGSLQRVQTDFNGHLSAVNQLLDPSRPAPAVTELLRMQIGAAHMAVQLEVMGKVIGRSTQNIDQLVRMQ
ncbi:MAG: type III secretion system inner rod subunit SctI [Rubrivivax sp.]|nr:type III secretion system inner rod subunit SctI [Rubrivivax sp.]